MNYSVFLVLAVSLANFVKLDFDVYDRHHVDGSLRKRSEYDHGDLSLRDIINKREADAQYQRINKEVMKRNALNKRDDSKFQPLSLANNKTKVFYVDITLGNPGQKLKVMIDTGSSDLWVYSSDNAYCSKNAKREYIDNENYGIEHENNLEKRDDAFDIIHNDYGIGYDNNLEKRDSMFDVIYSDYGVGYSSSSDSQATTTDNNNDNDSTQTEVVSTSSSDDATASSSSSSSSATSTNLDSSSESSSSTSSGSTSKSDSSTITSMESSSTSTTSESSSASSNSNSKGSVTTLTDKSSKLAGYLSTVPTATTIPTSLISKAAKPTLPCDFSGTFDKSKSSSFKNLEKSFYLSYADETFAKGTMSTDTLTWGQYTLENYTFALANLASSTEMVFGIGFPMLESSDPYENFPLRLVNDGLINRYMYSLYLNDKNATSGSILFGAVDTSKFNNDLVIVPLIKSDKSSGQPYTMLVTLDSMKVGNSSHNYTITGAKHPILLDSGTSQTSLPTQIFNNIASIPGVYYFEELVGFMGRCSVIENYNLEMVFGGVPVTIPLSTLAETAPQAVSNDLLSSNIPASIDKSDFCYLELTSTEDSYILAGDSLLRGLYIVYDLENYQIGLAPTNFDNSKSDIKVVGAYDDIPKATSAVSYSATYTSNAADSTLDGPFGTTSAASLKVFSGSKSAVSKDLLVAKLLATLFAVFVGMNLVL